MGAEEQTISRNAPCPCGSGKKYKHCHLGKPVGLTRRKKQFLIVLAFAVIIGGAAAVAQFWGWRAGGFTGVGGMAALVAYLVFTNPPPSRGRTGADRIDFGK
jgi:hypothetical protein